MCETSCKTHNIAVTGNFAKGNVLQASIIACGDFSDHSLILLSLKYVSLNEVSAQYAQKQLFFSHYFFSFQPHFYISPDKPPEILFS